MTRRYNSRIAERDFHHRWRETFLELAERNMFDIGHDPLTTAEYTPDNVTHFMALYKERRRCTFSKKFLETLTNIFMIGSCLIAFSMYLQNCSSKEEDKPKNRTQREVQFYKTQNLLIKQRDRLLNKIAMLETNNTFLVQEIDTIDLENVALREKIESLSKKPKRKKRNKTISKTPSQAELNEACLKSSSYTYLSRGTDVMLLESSTVKDLHCRVMMPHTGFYTPTTAPMGVRMRKGMLLYRVPPTPEEPPDTESKVMVGFKSMEGYFSK